MLVGLLLPAVQQAREAVRKTSCSNNMRQIALAKLNYESQQQKLPPAVTWPSSCKIPYGYLNGLIFILPQMEQQALYDQFDLSRNWNSTTANTHSGLSNKTASQTELPMLRCPTAPHDYEFISDYAANIQLNPSQITIKPLISSGQLQERSNWENALCYYGNMNGQKRQQRRLSEIRDGLSQSMLYFEDAGRPDRYKNGAMTKTNTVQGGEWATEQAYYEIHVYPFQNVDNDNETYSFHTGGSVTAFCDASVRFIGNSTDPDVYVSLFTCKANDTAGEGW